jgi:hypothetical protein
MLSELHNLNWKLCSKQYNKKFVLHLIVVPQLSISWQHNYSTKTSKAGWANELSMYSLMSMNDTHHNDTRHNDIHNNDTHHNDTHHNDIHLNDTRLNDTQHNDIQHYDKWNVTLCIMTECYYSECCFCWVSLMLSVFFMLNDVMLRVIAPSKRSVAATVSYTFRGL